MQEGQLWGFCEPCENWLCSSEWHAGAEPACPTCGASPALLERRDGLRGHVMLMLRLPPGAVEPAI